ncbi:MAG: outer membrane beta-barrel protein [Paludibacter sp.]|nr:outer membrane beta-barrel protein [Paludibacter sp.]
MFLNKKIKLTLLLIFTVLNAAFAQGGYDDDSRMFRFGFSLGLNTLDFGIKNSLKNIDGEVYYADVSTLKPGFSVGIVSDMLLHRYLNLRFTPTLHFGERELSYSNKMGDKKYSVVVPSVPLSLPFYLKYSAERYGDLRPYLIGGGGVYFDLGQNKEKPVYLRTSDTFVEFGVGCDIYFSFFKLAPELKFAIGFNDVFNPNPNTNILPEDKLKNLALSKLTSRMLTLTFNFE